MGCTTGCSRQTMRNRKYQTLVLLAALALVVFGVLPEADQAHTADHAGAGLPVEVAAVLKTHCVSCHGPEKQKNSFRVDTLDPDLLNGPHAEDWHEVLNALNRGEMPPKDKPALSDRERKALVGWITHELDRAAESKSRTDGRVVLRRLTRYEYNNTMSDLLGIEMDYAANLPPDSKSRDGYENNGQALGISTMQMEYYLQAARLGLSKAIVEGDRPEVIHHQASKSTQPSKRSAYAVAKAGLVEPGSAFAIKTLEFPREGVVRIRVNLTSVKVPEGSGYPRLQVSVGHRADVHSPEAPFGETDVIPAADGGSQSIELLGRIEDLPLPGHNPKFPGLMVVAANVYESGFDIKSLRRKQAEAAKAEKKRQAQIDRARKQGKPLPPDPDRKVEKIEIPEMPSFVVESIEFEGPIFDAWPPASHTNILFDRPGSMSEADYAKAVIERFISRAYRRPATNEDVRRVYEFYQSIRPKMPSFESAIREALAMVLISPEFLYLIEPVDGQDGEVRLTQHELASRLSYFLWSTMPDAELRQAANDKQLADDDVLEKQVRRMLADPRSEALAEQFISQWLDLSGIDRVAVNPQYYPQFDNSLKPHMKAEAIHFFAELLRHDLSAMNLIDSDFVMVNAPLARHYGLKGPMGMTFERVALENRDRRGGLMTQAGVLLLNSNGEDSHPIRRAVWLRSRLLDDPPAPPPPDVPELEADNPVFAKLPIKQQLELHNNKAACADCHSRLDPWGIPFEHYDAVGLWRDEVRRMAGKGFVKSPVDADAVLPGGQKVSGMADLKSVLLSTKRDEFVRALVRNLLTYSLGRTLDHTDRQDVEELIKQFESGGLQLDELIVAIAKSKAFQTK